ncbi:uncharacterized protein LOC131891273 [Tigriopus californicus]|uniref:uncharacterized protein LOC131891273 n=1 Tax=Tigriopus californicus TaxID=6832 RepID=UPI0027DA4DCE|nr:uncharacterized protein LOC131891273 [Tigriopus californicus]
MVIFILVIVGFFFQRNLAVLRFLAAIGVPCAWIHLVFLSGFHGATISIMFIHIMHKRFLGGILLTLTVATGCAAGFLIIAHNTASGVVDSRTLVKILFRPLLMILGEYEFIDTYETFEDDLPTLIYSTVLLLCIAIVGSLVLVNLLLALILSDIMDLYNICHSKNLFRQARQVVFYEKLAKTFGVKMVVPDRVRICAHKSCRCEHLKLRKSATAQIFWTVQQL